MDKKTEGSKMLESFIKEKNKESIPRDIISRNLLNHAIPKEEAEEYYVNRNTDTYKIYLSERNIPLIFIRKAEDNITTPVLTAELSSKWYTLYLIHPNGSVEAIDPNIEDDDVRYIDNLWHPEDLVKFCEKRGYGIDELFYEMLLGRWMNEIENIELN